MLPSQHRIMLTMGIAALYLYEEAFCYEDGAEQEQESTSDTAMIVGVSVGVIAFVLLLCAVCCCCCRVRRQRQSDMEGEFIDTFSILEGSSRLTEGDSDYRYGAVKRPQERQPQRVAAPRYRVLLDQKLGGGSFGSVFMGFDLENGSHVAVKRTPISKAQSVESLASEFEILKTLDSRHVVKVLEYRVNEKDDVAEFFMEWMSNGSVQTLIEQTQFRLHEQVVKRQLGQALRGLAYLHSKNVVHRDIKPGNMLVDGDGVVKLSDFGTSVLLEQGCDGSQTVMVGTIPYLAPECFTDGTYGPASDIWALACCVAEMASGIVPWTDVLPEERYNPVSMSYFIASAEEPNHHPTIPEHLSTALKEILKRCFEKDPRRRPTAEEVLNATYFDTTLPSDAESMKDYQALMKAVQDGAWVNSQHTGSGGLSSWGHVLDSMKQTYGATATIDLTIAQ